MWDHFLASYVTPTNRSSAFKNILKTPNFEIIGENPFQNSLFPICFKFGVFKSTKNALDLLVGVT